MDTVFDLFGDPVSAHHGKRGRPPYVPTNDDRNKIKMLLALGKSISIMANALAVSPATVKRYFRAELKVRAAMRDRMEAAIAMTYWKQFQEGSTAAGKAFTDFVARNDRMEAERDMASQPQQQEQVGKKTLNERQAIDADADLMAELDQEAATQNATTQH